MFFLADITVKTNSEGHIVLLRPWKKVFFSEEIFFLYLISQKRQECIELVILKSNFAWNDSQFDTFEREGKSLKWKTKEGGKVEHRLTALMGIRSHWILKIF
jgi:hypothetical protein